MAEPKAARESDRRGRRWPHNFALFALSAGVALLGTVGSIHRAGLWDPPELETAELARRIAEGLFGAPGFGPDAREPVPTRGELGRGELPFTLMALGFRAFGVVAWAGRLPLALFGLLGVAALFLLVRRLAGARAGALASLVLATMPLYFVQARTLLGEIVTFGAASAAMAALGLAAFDHVSARRRALVFALGLLALAVGFGARGLCIGVALPALGVGVAWLLLTLAGARLDRAGSAYGALALGLGTCALGLGMFAIARVAPDRYSMWVGAFTASGRPELTFDQVARFLGHALFPWSAVIPWAAGRLFGPVVAAPDAGGEQVQSLRMLLLTSAAVSLLGVGALGSELEGVVFPAPAALAGIAALALHDFDVGAPLSRAFGLCASALGVVLLVDFEHFPEKALAAFAVEGAVLPADFRALDFRWLALVTLLSFGAFFMLLQERTAPDAPRFERAEYLTWPRRFAELYRGNLFFGALLGASGLLTLELVFALGDRVPALNRFGSPGELSRGLLRLGWLAILTGAVAPVVLLFVRDGVRLLVAPRGPRTEKGEPWIGRGASAVVALSCTGFFASQFQYPALIEQLAPKQAVETYRRLAGPGEAFGAFGVDAGALRYENVGAIEELESVDAAALWLTQATSIRPGPRKFLVFRSRDLARLNAAFRARAIPSGNLPVFETGSSDFSIATSRLAPGERSQNPLDRLVLDRAPSPSRRLDVDLAGKLQVLGWDVQNTRGENVDRVSAGAEYELVIYYRVLDRITGEWDTFIHVDGFGRRHNADHPTLQGRYPLSLWRAGDWIADRQRLELEPNFAPGSYEVYLGLYSGSRRLEVRRGPHVENRIIAGRLTVR
jgi:4-amino-4-deoxy-L-arabinose transferase-like glycosyltransferase